MPILNISPRRLPPEIDFLVLSFLAHFTWEILQAPLFASLGNTDHFVGIAVCLKATFGDLAIALAAFWGAAILGKGRNWYVKASYTPSPAEAEFGDLTSGFGTIQLCL
jgi:hypothetical protein